MLWEDALVEDEALCCPVALGCGAAGEEGRELDAVDGRPLSLFLEDLEESEKETLCPGVSIPSDVFGRCQR